MSEGWTDKEEEQLKKLLAKKREAGRKEAAFLKEADARKDDLLARWGVEKDATSGIKISVSTYQKLMIVAGKFQCSSLDEYADHQLQYVQQRYQ